MANCPNCGSDHIQLKRETDVNWGRAVVGWAIFGVVGGAVGAVTGEDRNINACLNCGTSWKAADLHKLLQIIKKLTNLNLDLSEEIDRTFVNDFMSEFSSDLESVPNIEKQGQKLIAEIQSNSKATAGCSLGCGASIVLVMVSSSIAATAGSFIVFLMFALPIAGYWIGAELDKISKKSIEREIEKIKRETQIKILDAEESLRAKFIDFIQKYPLVAQRNEWFPQPVAPLTISEEVLISEHCPRCDSKLPPPFQASNRIVCSKCGWSNKPKNK
jgi:hypothetical protein